MPLAAGICTPFINRSAEEVEPTSVHKNPTRHLPRMSVSLTDECRRNPPFSSRTRFCFLAIWCCTTVVSVSMRARAYARHSPICGSGRGQLRLPIGRVPAPMERHPNGNPPGWICLEKMESSSEGTRSNSSANRSAEKEVSAEALGNRDGRVAVVDQPKGSEINDGLRRRPGIRHRRSPAPDRSCRMNDRRQGKGSLPRFPRLGQNAPSGCCA